MARRTRRLLALALAATSLVVPACAHAAATIGIDDPRAGTFLDQRFKSLGIRYARLVIPWDRITDPGVDKWIHEAGELGVEPLVTFEHGTGDNCPSSPCPLPTIEQFGAVFDVFRARHPNVLTYSPWNEENHPSQPTAVNPQRAADYYNLMRARCPSCLIVAADVLGTNDAPQWIAEFRRWATDDPQLWGLHNYPDLNYFNDAGTKAFAAAVPGEIWLTETGGIVNFTRTNGQVVLPYDEQRAADALTYLFHYVLPTYGPRISRVYVHEWRASKYSLFDSGLISPAGSPRPALDVLRAALPAPEPSLKESHSGVTAPDGPGSPGESTPRGGGDHSGVRPAGQVLRLARLRVGRAVRATLQCTPGPNTCRGVLRLVTVDELRQRKGLHPLRVTVGLEHIAIRAGRNAAVTLHLTKVGRRLAQRRGLRRLAVLLTLGPRDGGFPRWPLTRTWVEVR